MSGCGDDRIEATVSGATPTPDLVALIARAPLESLPEAISAAAARLGLAAIHAPSSLTQDALEAVGYAAEAWCRRLRSEEVEPSSPTGKALAAVVAKWSRARHTHRVAGVELQDHPEWTFGHTADARPLTDDEVAEARASAGLPEKHPDAGMSDLICERCAHPRRNHAPLSRYGWCHACQRGCEFLAGESDERADAPGADAEDTLPSTRVAVLRSDGTAEIVRMERGTRPADAAEGECIGGFERRGNACVENDTLPPLPKNPGEARAQIVADLSDLEQDLERSGHAARAALVGGVRSWVEDGKDAGRAAEMMHAIPRRLLPGAPFGEIEERLRALAGANATPDGDHLDPHAQADIVADALGRAASEVYDPWPEMRKFIRDLHRTADVIELNIANPTGDEAAMTTISVILGAAAELESGDTPGPTIRSFRDAALHTHAERLIAIISTRKRALAGKTLTRREVIALGLDVPDTPIRIDAQRTDDNALSPFVCCVCGHGYAADQRRVDGPESCPRCAAEHDRAVRLAAEPVKENTDG